MDVDFKPDFLSADEAIKLLEELLAHVPWSQHKTGWGNPRPRLEAWYGDSGAVYANYNGGMQPLPWTDCLQALRIKVEAATGARFNSVLLNRYRDENDSVAKHADDEPEFGGPKRDDAESREDKPHVPVHSR